jgi:hypothetical protein
MYRIGVLVWNFNAEFLATVSLEPEWSLSTNLFNGHHNFHCVETIEAQIVSEVRGF